MHGLCHIANLVYCLHLPEPRSTKAETPSVGKLLSLSHFRQGGIFERVFMVITPGTRWKQWQPQERDKEERLWYRCSLLSSSFRSKTKTKTKNNKKLIEIQRQRYLHHQDYDHHHHHHHDQTANNGEQDVLFLFLKDTLGFSTAGNLFKTFYGFRLLILMMIMINIMMRMRMVVRALELEINNVGFTNGQWPSAMLLQFWWW